MTTNKLDALIEWVREWPDEDQEELVAYASEIEARRAGPYHASPEELRILDEAMAAARAVRSRRTTKWKQSSQISTRMKVVFSRRALADLDEVLTYLTQRSTTVASSHGCAASNQAHRRPRTICTGGRTATGHPPLASRALSLRHLL